jgi:methylmalonyl-CoA/ethylmalonyl-CoA epimerase
MGASWHYRLIKQAVAMDRKAQMSLKNIGPIMQIAFVPADFDAAIRYWTTVMGVGPFFLIENVALEEMRYLGEPSDCIFTMALAY